MNIYKRMRFVLACAAVLTVAVFAQDDEVTQFDDFADENESPAISTDAANVSANGTAATNSHLILKLAEKLSGTALPEIVYNNFWNCSIVAFLNLSYLSAVAAVL